MKNIKTYEQLVLENEALSLQLEEAAETIDAIRTGQVDALVVKGSNGHELYTLKTADLTYRIFIENMNEGAITLNEKGVILFCNSKFASMVDFPLSNVIGLSFESFIDEDSKSTFQHIFTTSWLTDTKTELIITGSARPMHCLLSITLLELEDGKSLSVILTDLTYQKETQELLKFNNQRLEDTNAELEVSNLDLQQFASVASHDLQEPLRKILIFSTMIRNKLNGELDKESGAHLDKIILSAERLRTMVHDILNYSRLSAHSYHVALTDLTEVVGEVLEDYEVLIREKHAVITIKNLPCIEVNRGQIRQVFQNLISNALKFSKVGVDPILTITGATNDKNQPGRKDPNDIKTCSITFSDNGIGFDQVYGEKIFTLFQRLNTKDKYEGSGIGLAITKRIIDKHNGQITAFSEPDKGASFVVTLPIRQIQIW